MTSGSTSFFEFGLTFITRIKCGKQQSMRSPATTQIGFSRTTKLNHSFLLLRLVIFLLLTALSKTNYCSASKISSIMGQTMSASQFYLYGRKHFTQTGYLKHAKKYETAVQSSAAIKRGEDGSDGVDLEGKVVMITGANSGIGKELATYAAAKGAKLYMVCRSKDRAEAARKEISDLTSNTDISVLLADVGELSQVRKLVEEFQAKESRVDCLVCNAGVLLRDREETSDGYETTFASHFLGGSYLLSQLLLPQLKRSGGRVVFVSSGGMYSTSFPSDWNVATSTKESKAAYSGDLAYAYSKRGQVLLAERLAKEIPDVTWVSSHPGWTYTSAVEKAYGDNKKYLEPMRTTWEGAEGISWLIGAEKEKLESGAFYLDRKPQVKHLSGPFFSEGSYTKNSSEDVTKMIEKLKEAAGV